MAFMQHSWNNEKYRALHKFVETLIKINNRENIMSYYAKTSDSAEKLHGLFYYTIILYDFFLLLCNSFLFLIKSLINNKPFGTIP